MATVGGVRKGAGRPPGSANAKTRAIADQAAREGITPLEFMLNVMKDTTASFDQRFDAAKFAAPYVHPRLSAVDAKIDAGGLREWLTKED